MRESNGEHYLAKLLVSNERHAERILSSAASVRSSDWEVTEKEGEMLVSILDKSPPPTLCVDPPETLELLSNFDDTE
jgi:hypothetical protein